MHTNANAVKKTSRTPPLNGSPAISPYRRTPRRQPLSSLYSVAKRRDDAARRTRSYAFNRDQFFSPQAARFDRELRVGQRIHIHANQSVRRERHYFRAGVGSAWMMAPISAPHSEQNRPDISFPHREQVAMPRFAEGPPGFAGALS